MIALQLDTFALRKWPSRCGLWIDVESWCIRCNVLPLGRNQIKLHEHQWRLTISEPQWRGLQFMSWSSHLPLITITNTYSLSQITSRNEQSPMPCPTRRLWLWLMLLFVSSSQDLEYWGSFTPTRDQTSNLSCFRRCEGSLKLTRQGPCLYNHSLTVRLSDSTGPSGPCFLSSFTKTKRIGISTYVSLWWCVSVLCAWVYWLLTEQNDVGSWGTSPTWVGYWASRT